MATKKVKLVLLKTVVHQGKHYWPDTVVEWDEDVAGDLIDRQAAEPCSDVVPVFDDEDDDGEVSGEDAP